MKKLKKVKKVNFICLDSLQEFYLTPEFKKGFIQVEYKGERTFYRRGKSETIFAPNKNYYTDLQRNRFYEFSWCVRGKLFASTNSDVLRY